jgi:hypothetical protein
MFIKSLLALLPLYASQYNDLPPRLQWDNNAGYCGEVSLISAGLYYGQYASQYDVRAIAIQNKPQNKGQLLLGTNDLYTAEQMHLNAIEWNTVAEQNTNDFLAWVKQQVVLKHPVAIGIYTNEYRFYGNTNPNAGDSEYDHIVPVYGCASNHPLTDPSYYPDDTLFFSDNGLWSNPTPPYRFSFICDPCQGDRKSANDPNGPIYSLSNDATNYGIAITGVLDLNNDTLPVRLATNLNAENPPIAKHSTIRPVPEPLILTLTISNLEPQTPYYLYKYDNFAQVPNSNFNAHAQNAVERWPIEISSGTTFTLQEEIFSNEIAVYRCVKTTAP